MGKGRRDRVHKNPRNVDRWIAALIVALAVGSGVLAGYLGEAKSWARPASAPVAQSTELQGSR